MDMIQEQSIEELTKKVVEEISVQHPIMYDTHNICELVCLLQTIKVFCTDASRHVQFLQLDI